jgi:hypothetical protein
MRPSISTLSNVVRAAEISLKSAAGLLVPGHRPGNGAPGKRRIAFQTFACHLAIFFEPIIRELQNDPTTEVSFIVLPHPHFPAAETRRLEKMAVDTFGLPPERVRSYWRSRWDRFDLVVHADVYARFPLRKTKNALLLHGTVNPERCFRRHPFRKTVYDFDFALVFGQFDETEFDRLQPTRRLPLRTYAVGCPLQDRLLRPLVSRERYCGELGLDAGKKTVLFAPHWSQPHVFGRDPAAGFVEGVREVMDLDVNVVVKPHQMALASRTRQARGWREALPHVRRLGAAIDPDIEDTYALLYADVLVSDISTRLFNFMLLDKPAVVYSPPFEVTTPQERVRQALLARACLWARDAREVKDLVCRLLDNPALLGAERRRIAESCFSHLGSATAQTLSVLRAELGRA